MILSKENLKVMYLQNKLSTASIARKYNYSEHKINYWLKKYGIKKRSISEAIYIKHNPNGDPFKFNNPRTLEEAQLFGMGLGLYWGEGTKANKNSIRLGNSDPKLIKKFMEFLVKIFGLSKNDFQFGLQIFTDIDSNEALDFWTRELKIKKHQIYKPIITRSGSLGTYRKKSKYGVITILYHNTKLRNLLIDYLPM